MSICYRRPLALVLLPAIFFSQFTWAWGRDGHFYINRVAAQSIPHEMPKFFRHAVDRIEYLAPEPDRWYARDAVTLKNAQEPDHFINMERLGGLGELPNKRYEFYKRLYEMRAKIGTQSLTEGAIRPDELLPETVGLQPYAAIEVYERLKIAFRDYRTLKAERKSTKAVEQNAVFYAGWLGHYVGDGSQPLHTTIYYNGWFGPNPNRYTTSHDTHSNFESKFVANNIRASDFRSLMTAPVKLNDPFRDYVEYLRHSNGLVEKFYQLEKTGAFRDQGTKEGLEFTRERLAAGSQMLLNLWYTAWVESAAPVPPYPPPPAPSTKPEFWLVPANQVSGSDP